MDGYIWFGKAFPIVAQQILRVLLLLTLFLTETWACCGDGGNEFPHRSNNRRDDNTSKVSKCLKILTALILIGLWSVGNLIDERQ
jgi:hypothetical protein